MCLKYKSFENTVVKGEIPLSNFFFSHSVFYPFEELSAIFIKFKIAVCEHFLSLKGSKMCRLRKG